MGRRTVSSRVAWIVGVSLSLCSVASAGEVIAWGFNLDNDVNQAPAGTDYTQIALGDSHGLALTAAGTVVAWGRNREGACTVPAGTYKAVGAGAYFSMAVRTDGSLAVWGDDKAGQVAHAPTGTGFTAVDGGLLFAVALKSDGSIVAWGDDSKGQVSGAPKTGGFTALAAGDYHALALRADGSLVCWGNPLAAAGMPTGAGFRKIDAGGNHSIALRADGSLACWGSDLTATGTANVPAGNDYVNVGAGVFHALAVKGNGSVVGWGGGPAPGTYPNLGQADPPARNDLILARGGLYFSAALTGATNTGGADPNAGGGGDTGGDANDPGGGDANDVEGSISYPATVTDNFDDNSIAGVWRLRGDDPAQCWLAEANQRLELRATAQAAGVSVRYAARGWRIDPAHDFQMKVDFHCDLALGNTAVLAVILEPNSVAVTHQSLEFGVSSGTPANYWYSVTDGNAVSTKQNVRTTADGTLYLSYDKAADELYLSNEGYGVAHAWATVKGFLRGRWGAQSMALSLLGQSDRLALASGPAFFDNFSFQVNEPVVEANQPSNVYRFWCPATDRHFYTISESEKTKLIDKYANVWVYEGVAFTAASAAFNARLAPVYRFWSPSLGCHFYTVSEAEKTSYQKQSPLWTFEGTAFYAYPEGKQPTGSKAIYRFLRQSDGTYFYTVSESERDKLVSKYAHVYTAAGIAFYSYEP